MSLAGFKRALIGKSLPNSAQSEERLTKTAALSVLSSDALSSVAYATEEILKVLVLVMSVSALNYSLPIAGGIILLLAIVILSYSQTVKAYPHGGGAYTVASENLGLFPGLVAGASLLIDYILTVSVSIAGGTAALTSLYPALEPHRVLLCLIFTFLLMLANMRGLKESGNLFMVPTYAFIVSIFLLVIVGIYHQITGQIPDVRPVLALPAHKTQESLGLFILLRAFAQGCTAMTGVEAISNGVMVFKKPEWKNARLTLIYLGLLLGAMFAGITYIAHVYHVVPDPTEQQTLLALLGREIFGGSSPLFYFLQYSTLLILVLAANTSYADFPRLSYFLAKDGFLPRQLAILGDRLVYSNGIILLSAAAAILIVIFKGSLDAIIPLYAVGVFTSFTLSQSGMVVHWYKEKSPKWQISALMNGLGAIATFLVLGIIVITKFKDGAGLIVVAVPLVVWMFISINNHYRYVTERISISDFTPRPQNFRRQILTANHPAIVIVGQLNLGTVEALDYARSIADEIVAIHVDIGSTDRVELDRCWQELAADIPLKILDSPYRSVVEPIVEFIGYYESAHPDVLSTIIIPCLVTRHWWEKLLHNQTTLFLKAALLNNKSRVITSVRYYI